MKSTCSYCGQYVFAGTLNVNTLDKLAADHYEKDASIRRICAGSFKPVTYIFESNNPKALEQPDPIELL